MSSTKDPFSSCIDDLATPAFIVDLDKVRRNCDLMLDSCKQLGIQLRAQTKTHKTIQGADLQTGGSKRCLVTSTLAEAEFFADADFDDILYGFPLIPQHMPRVAALTSRLSQFHVLVDSDAAVEALTSTTPPAGKKWSVFLKVDCGNNRAGVWWADDAKGVALIRKLECDVTYLAGVYVHCGDSYGAGNELEVEGVRDGSVDRLLSFVEKLGHQGIGCPVVGIGSTPTCRHPGVSMKRLTEIHPGNYTFLDVQQSQLGSCSLEDIACCVATRVIGHYPRRNQMLIDCGFTGLTKQGLGKMATGYAVIKNNPNLK